MLLLCYAVGGVLAGGKGGYASILLRRGRRVCGEDGAVVGFDGFALRCCIWLLKTGYGWAGLMVLLFCYRFMAASEILGEETANGAGAGAASEKGERGGQR
jgi:hypothetical protein